MSRSSVFARRRARFFDGMKEGVARPLRNARGRVRPRCPLPLSPGSGPLLSDRIPRARGRRGPRRGPQDVHAVRQAEGPSEGDVGRPPRRSRGRRARSRRGSRVPVRGAFETPPRSHPARACSPLRLRRSCRRRPDHRVPPRTIPPRGPEPEARAGDRDGSDGSSPRDAPREGAGGDRAHGALRGHRGRRPPRSAPPREARPLRIPARSRDRCALPGDGRERPRLSRRSSHPERTRRSSTTRRTAGASPRATSSSWTRAASFRDTRPT